MKEFMGLTSTKSGSPTKRDAKIGKNYLASNELYALHILCEQFLLYAESRAIAGQELTMTQLNRKFDQLLEVQGYPLFKEYKKIIMKTLGFENLLKSALKDVKGLKNAYLFGSYAEDRMDSFSDVDVLAVGDYNTLDLQRAVLEVQKKLDREINVIGMSPREFDKRKKTDPLIQSIFKKKSITLL